MTIDVVLDKPAAVLRPDSLSKEILENLKNKSIEGLLKNIFHDNGHSYTLPSGALPPQTDEQVRFFMPMKWLYDVPLDESDKLVLYPHQWLWDTFFIAAWNPDIKQAQQDIKIFLNGQEANGRLGHIRYNGAIEKNQPYFPPARIYYKDGVLPESGAITSKITQPPNAAWGAWELAKRITNDQEKRAFVAEVFPKLMAYHEYIYQNRVRDGLMVTIHPWEAGDDNSPKWDNIYTRLKQGKNINKEVYDWLTRMDIPYKRIDKQIVNPRERPIDPDYDIYLYLIKLYGEWGWDEAKIMAESPFRVQDPMTNALLLNSNKALAEMAMFLDKTEEAATIEQWTKETQGGLNLLWDKTDGFYYVKDMANNELIKIKTNAGLVPLFSQAIPAENAQALAGNLTKLLQENPYIYTVPSTFPEEDGHFEPNRYWRGPVWIAINALIADGLDSYGYKDLARIIRVDSLQLVEKTLKNSFSFNEYFDCYLGNRLGSPAQSWTMAAVIHMIQAMRQKSDS